VIIVMNAVLALVGQVMVIVALWRLLSRTGHGGGWRILPFVPAALGLAVALVMGRSGIGGWTGAILVALAQLVLPAILLFIVFKRWPRLEAAPTDPEVFQ
jgi:hypothetical protein